MRITVASTVVFLLLSIPAARGMSSHDELASDPAVIAQLEQRAEHAEAREQAFLYTQLVHVYTQVAGRQMAAGEMEQANATLKRVEQCAAKVHGGLAKDTKKLKDAEMLLHAATFHLGQSIRTLSSEDKAAAQATLKQLDKLHDELLAQVFAH